MFPHFLDRPYEFLYVLALWVVTLTAFAAGAGYLRLARGVSLAAVSAGAAGLG